MKYDDNKRMMRMRSMFMVVAVLLSVMAAAGSGESFRNNIPLEEGVSSGRFIIPNEFYPQSFELPLTGRKGAMIAVGSFRGLFDAGFGDFSDVILLDYDDKIVKFNRAHLALIQQSHDRFDYLSKIFSRSPPVDILNKARSGLITDSDFIAELRKLSYIPMESQTPQMRAMNEALGGLPEMSEINRPWKRLGFDKIIHQFSKNEVWQKVFPGSDAHFAKIKKLIAEGNVHVLHGNLAGDKVLPKISEILRKNGILVSVVDVSNAVEHILEHSPALTGQFTSNVQGLPLFKDAVVLLTLDSRFPAEGMRFPPASADRFLYIAAEAREFNQACGTTLLKSHDNYQRWFIQSLKARGTNQNPLYTVGHVGICERPFSSRSRKKGGSVAGPHCTDRVRRWNFEGNFRRAFQHSSGRRLRFQNCLQESRVNEWPMASCWDSKRLMQRG